MTQPSIAGALGNYTPYNKKCKWWMEIADAVTLW